MRLVVTCAGDELNVSVVCDGTSTVTALSEDWSTAGEVDVVASDDSVWFLIRHRLQNEARDHVLAG